MKPLKIRNECDETIEIKYDGDGVIKIRHSDIDPKSWAVLHQYDQRLRQAGPQDFLAKKGIGVSRPEISEMVKKLGGRMGGYVVLGAKTYEVDSHEIALIHTAIKQAGGIVPNWTSQP